LPKLHNTAEDAKSAKGTINDLKKLRKIKAGIIETLGVRSTHLTKIQVPKKTGLRSSLFLLPGLCFLLLFLSTVN
jgi:hypothetical protein